MYRDHAKIMEESNQKITQIDMKLTDSTQTNETSGMGSMITIFQDLQLTFTDATGEEDQCFMSVLPISSSTPQSFTHIEVSGNTELELWCKQISQLQQDTDDYISMHVTHSESQHLGPATGLDGATNMNTIRSRSAEPFTNSQQLLHNSCYFDSASVSSDHLSFAYAQSKTIDTDDYVKYHD